MKNRGSASGMFLIELLLALLIFAIASAICLQVFVTAHLLSAESNNINHAVVAAQNVAECFKASNGDLAQTANLLQGSTETADNRLTQYFNSEWKPAASNDFNFILEVTLAPQQGGFVSGELTVNAAKGDLLFAIPISALEVRP